jgi:hypothetical protein
MTVAPRTLVLASWIVLSLVSLNAQWRPGPMTKRIKWSNQEWLVKDSGGARVGPGSNYFDTEAVRVDARGLTLSVIERDGRYYCGEVVTAASLGYGTYRFVVASEVDLLGDNLTLGLFTWSDDPGEEGSHKELDVELGRWGNPANDIAQYVVQPYTRPQNIVRFPLPKGAKESTHSFEWLRGEGRFRSEVGGATVKEHRFTRGVPTPDKEQARMNLWITGGRVPMKGLREVTIRSFEFIPAEK